MRTVYLKPWDVFYSQSSISNRFSDNSPHEGVLIGKTLDDIVEGRSQVEDLPLITVVRIDHKFYSRANRRLWVLRRLTRMGLISQIVAKESRAMPRTQFTTFCGGIQVEVRGDHGSQRWPEFEVAELARRRECARRHAELRRARVGCFSPNRYFSPVKKTFINRNSIFRSFQTKRKHDADRMPRNDGNCFDISGVFELDPFDNSINNTPRAMSGFGQYDPSFCRFDENTGQRQDGYNFVNNQPSCNFFNNGNPGEVFWFTGGGPRDAPPSDHCQLVVPGPGCTQFMSPIQPGPAKRRKVTPGNDNSGSCPPTRQRKWKRRTRTPVKCVARQTQASRDLATVVE